MNISSYVEAMSEKKFVLNMPEGTGLLAYHERGEWGEDCYGNAFPACGGCLWAQGIIQCP
jgi:hypothetical protein